MRYRLISDIRVSICDCCAYITAPDDKQGSALAKKQLRDIVGNRADYNTKELHISSENVKMVFEESCFKVSFPELPDSWFILVNYDEGNLFELISHNSIKNGSVEELFEIAIKSSTKKVILLNPGMPSYQSALDESVRCVNCSMLKTTKKRIPGHRYDTKDETIYWLGELSSYIDNPRSSEFVKNIDDSKTIYLYTKDVQGAKKISDILKNGLIDNQADSYINGKYQIYTTTSIKLMVDSGQVLENDWTNYNTAAEMLFNSAIDYYDKYIKESDKYYIYQNGIDDRISYVINILNFRDSDSISESLIERFRKFIGKSALDIYPAHINHGLVSSTSDENYFLRWYTSIIKSDNIKKYSYYNILFTYLNIDIESIVKPVIEMFSLELDIYNNFEKYVKYDFGSRVFSSLRSKKSSEYELKEVTIESLIPEETLRNTIISLCNYARSNYGDGIYTYEVLNCGTKANPLIYETMTVNVFNIIDKYKKEGLEVPENLKEEILNNKFNTISISVDKDRELC